MHDPLTLVGTVPGPWLRKDWKGRWRLGQMVDVWHHDPSDYDSTTCAKHRWRWHVHHYRPRLLPWFTWRRRLTTRCQWCAQRHKKKDPVNVSQGWGAGEGTRWWQREKHLYHRDCSRVAAAHKTCLCPLAGPRAGTWEFDAGSMPYGRCARCGLYRPWRSRENYLSSPEPLTTGMWQGVPAGQRPDPELVAEIHAIWDEHRREQRRHQPTT